MSEARIDRKIQKYFRKHMRAQNIQCRSKEPEILILIPQYVIQKIQIYMVSGPPPPTGPGSTSENSQFCQALDNRYNEGRGGGWRQSSIFYISCQLRFFIIVFDLI